MTVGLLSIANPAVIIPAGGLVINLVPFTNWSSAPADYQSNAVIAANLLMAQFPNTNITVNIQIEYGTLEGSVAFSSRQSGSIDVTGNSIPYTTLRSAFSALSNQTSELASVITNLPTGSTIGGSSGLFTSFACCKLLGLFGGTNPVSATDSAIDGYVGMGSGWTSGESLGVLLHEMRQVLGGIVQRAPFVFSRFRSAGVWDTASATHATYFSLDGGTTNLANYDDTSDFADLAFGVIDPVSGLWDSFGAYTSQTGTPSLQGLSTLDIKMIRAMGYR